MAARYPWLASACAPEAFPVRLLEGRFLVGDDEILQIPRSVTLHNGWGESGLVSLTLGSGLPLPERLRISWFSLAEDRFHGGDFDLPADKLVALFAKGFMHPESVTPSTWTTILVGMAPGGRIVLWLTGGGLAVELCRAVAPELALDWNQVPASEGFTRADYLQTHLLRILGPEGLRQLRAQPINPEEWDRLHVRAPWALEWIGPAAGASVRLRCLNAEREHQAHFEQASVVPERSRGLPMSMVVRWVDDAGLRRVAHVQLDNDEVRSAFAKLHPADRRAIPLTLQVDVSNDADGVRVYLCDPIHSLELLEGQIRNYRAA